MKAVVMQYLLIVLNTCWGMRVINAIEKKQPIKLFLYDLMWCFLQVCKTWEKAADRTLSQSLFNVYSCTIWCVFSFRCVRHGKLSEADEWLENCAITKMKKGRFFTTLAAANKLECLLIMLYHSCESNDVKLSTKLKKRISMVNKCHCFKFNPSRSCKSFKILSTCIVFLNLDRDMYLVKKSFNIGIVSCKCTVIQKTPCKSETL